MIFSQKFHKWIPGKTQTIAPTEIDAILWKACDTFRGTIDPSDFTTVDQAIALPKQQLEQLRQHKQGLMQRLLTGQVRVQGEEAMAI